MEAGERWMLNDVTGKPIRAWDSRGFMRRMTYDELRRPTGLFVTENGAERLAERLRRLRVHGQLRQYVYGEVGINSRLDEVQAAHLAVGHGRAGGQLGEQGLVATSAVSGAFDVDVAVLSALRLVGQSASATTVGEAVLAALAVNAMVRLVLAMLSGPVRFWLPLVLATALAGGLGCRGCRARGRSRSLRRVSRQSICRGLEHAGLPPRR